MACPSLFWGVGLGLGGWLVPGDLGGPRGLPQPSWGLCWALHESRGASLRHQAHCSAHSPIHMRRYRHTAAAPGLHASPAARIPGRGEPAPRPAPPCACVDTLCTTLWRTIVYSILCLHMRCDGREGSHEHLMATWWCSGGFDGAVGTPWGGLGPWVAVG